MPFLPTFTMLSRESALTALEIALHPATDLLVADGVDREELTRFLEQDLRASLCDPFQVTIEEFQPNLKAALSSRELAVFCVATRSGTSLFYHPQTHRFFGAHGQAPHGLVRQAIQASPLACWAGSVRLALRGN
ncbi:hypothetical protein AACH10_03105 [Ideonella sp. DXS22W]|uniref:Uncharacterized protein n=1 Tax=Pseudaquabacterium inlustre TaxID=2984192 RepID=A0ABU9CBT9_9BURK